MAEKALLLIVEDDLDLAEMLASYFKVQGYEVISAAWGEEAVKLGHARVPDLVVLDIRLPDIDGYEVCRRLRAHRRTGNIPVIFLTEKRDRVDKLAGLELGVVDYITKPFDIQELRLRVRNALRRADLISQYNPVTGLPQSLLVDERLDDMLAGDGWAVLVVRIEGLDSFRADYGFKAADDVLRNVAEMMKRALVAGEDAEAFIGHLDGDGLVLIAALDRADGIRERIAAGFEAAGESLYALQDRAKARQAMRDHRLRLAIVPVTARDGVFEDVDALKEALLHAYQNR